MGARDLLTSDNSNWVAPVAPTADTTFLSQDQWNQQTPTLIPDPEGEGSGAMKFNPATYSDYINSLPDAVIQAHPHEYASAKTQDLVNGLFTAFAGNNSPLSGGSMVGNWTNQLEQFKQTDPAAYYNAVLSLDLKKAGWDAGQGKTNDITNARIQSNLQDAAKAGAINADQYNNLVANNYSNTANWHAQNIAQRAGDGATLGGLPQFALTAAGLGVGLGGLICALAPAALAEGGAALASPDAYMASAGLNPGTFEGAAFTMPELAAAPTYTSPTDYMNQAGLDAGNFQGANFQIPTDTTANDVLNAANNAKKAYNLANAVAKIGGGNSGVATGGTTGSTTSGTDLSKIASLLVAKPYQGIELAQLQQKNPFLFATPGQTQASQGMYDVSGSNLANALRKS